MLETEEIECFGCAELFSKDEVVYDEESDEYYCTVPFLNGDASCAEVYGVI